MKINVVYIVIILILFLLLVSCKHHYSGISKPDSNGDALIVGYQNRGPFGTSSRVWLMNVKKRTIQRIDVEIQKRGNK